MPRLRQRRGELQRAPPEIAIGDAPAAMDDRDVVGIDLRRALEKVSGVSGWWLAAFLSRSIS